MPSRYDKGITININGNAEGLSKALKTVNSDIYNAKQTIKSLDEALKLDPKNVELLKQKYASLNQILEATKKQLEMMNEAQNNADTKGIDKQKQSYKNLVSDINKTKIEIDTLGKSMQNLSNTTEQLDIDAEIAKNNVSIFGDSMSGLANKIDLTALSTGQLGITIEGISPAFAIASTIVKKFISELKETAQVLGEIGKTIATEFIDVLGQGVDYDASIETYITRLSSFQTVAEKADEVFATLKKDALESPFSVDALVESSTMLLSTGKDIDSVRQTILALGNAIAKTGGDDSTLTRMAQNLQQVANAGKASAIDLRQFAYAGIDIYGLLKEYEGIVYENAEKTPVTYAQLTDALLKASQEGGKYFNGMSVLASTYNGKINKLKASWQTLTGVIANDTKNMLGNIITETNLALAQIITALENGDMAKVTEIIKNWVQNCLSVIKEELPNIINTIKDIAVAVIEALNDSEIKKSLQETIKVLLDSVSAFIQVLQPQIKSLMMNISNLVIELLNDSDIRNNLANIASKIAEIIVQGYKTYLKAKWGGIYKLFFTDTENSVKEIVSDIKSTKYSVTAGEIQSNNNGAWSSYTGNSSGTTIINNNNVSNEIDVDAISKKTAKQIQLAQLYE